MKRPELELLAQYLPNAASNRRWHTRNTVLSFANAAVQNESRLMPFLVRHEATASLAAGLLFPSIGKLDGSHVSRPPWKR